jgi:hypothetical protein
MTGVGSDRRFSYDGYELDPSARTLRCRYSIATHRFVETVTFEAPAASTRADDGTTPAGAWEGGAVDAAARIVYLLAGVSYYKTLAPPVVDLGDVATTRAERRFLRTFLVEGLGEFAYRNRLDLSGLEVVGPGLEERRAARVPRADGAQGGRPLIPFGGGIDSIVTTEHVRRTHPDASLFVVSRSGDRFDAIERPAALTGLPVVRAARDIDPAVADPAASSRGFRNGHVPVTGILSAIGVMAAVLGGHGAVVMSNERSASAPTLERDGAHVNHQWSKGLVFEVAFRELLDATFEGGPAYFSFLRARSELWVAREFAALPGYHGVFRSCNRAFALDPARRLEAWCGECEKCTFVDLVLAPYLAASDLAQVFGGREPLCEEATGAALRALVATGSRPRPFECVGDEEECRVAALRAAARPDRAACGVLQRVAAEVRAATPGLAADTASAAERRQLAEGGPSFVPVGLGDVECCSGAAAGGLDDDRRATAPSPR